MAENATETETNQATATSEEQFWSTPTATPLLTLGPITDLVVKFTYFVIGSFGLIGNVFVVVVICSLVSPKYRITNILIVNQSLIDTLAAVMMILSAADNQTNTKLNKNSFYDQFVCRIWLSSWPLWSLLLSSTYSIASLSVERYVAIVHPIFYKNKIASSRYAVYAFALASVLSGVLFQLSWSIPSSDIVDGNCYALNVWNVSIEARKTVGFVIFVCQYLLPVTVMTFCYARIYKVIQSKVTPNGGSSRFYDGGGGGVYKKVKRNVLKTSATVFLGFLLCNTCNEFFILLFNLGRPSDFTSWFYRFTVIAAFANCCVNPVIYVVEYREFQRGIHLLLRRLSAVVSRQSAAKTGGDCL